MWYGIDMTHNQVVRMVCNDLVRRLSLLDQRTDDPVFLVKFTSGHTDTRTGLFKAFAIFAVSKSGIVSVFVCDGTVGNLFLTAVADIRSPVKPYTAFFFKVSASLVAGRAGCTFDSAQDDLSTGVSLLTVIAVNAEVFSIIESPFVIPIRETVSSDFFRDCGRVLAQEPGNILKGSTRIQLVFDIDTVFKSKMFLVTRNIFTHYEPPSTAVRRRDNHTMNV